MRTGNQLTKNFKLEHFFVSGRHPQLARIAKYTRCREHDGYFYFLCLLLLQVVRDVFKVPVHISSGHRDIFLNEKVGGSEHSLHMQSMAVDFYTDDKELLHSIYDFIQCDLAGRFCELILYVDESNIPINIHVALPSWGRKLKIKKVVRESK